MPVLLFSVCTPPRSALQLLRVDRPRSIAVRDNPPRHLLAVFLPVLAVLCAALGLIPPLAMDQEDGKVDHVEVRDGYPPSPCIALVDHGRPRRTQHGNAAVRDGHGHDLMPDDVIPGDAR